MYKRQGLGYKNDIVNVKSGYGRNYLIPQGKGVDVYKRQTENVLRTYIKIIPTGAMHQKNGYNYAGDVKFKRVKLYDKDKAHKLADNDRLLAIIRCV